MKGALLGFASIFLLAGLLWLVAFGATAPCEAMQAEARKLALQKNDAKSRAIAEALGSASSGTFSGLECTSMAVRMKLFGAPGVTVIGAGLGLKK